MDFIVKHSDKTEQLRICEKYRLEWVESAPQLKVGIVDNVKNGELPINGLRHAPVGDATGWYIWAGGEPSPSADFFKPLHVDHVRDWCPAVLPFLGLPPGSRFQIAPGHEDVWYDKSLVKET